jgi:hypothetical protein
MDKATFARYLRERRAAGHRSPERVEREISRARQAFYAPPETERNARSVGEPDPLARMRQARELAERFNMQAELKLWGVERFLAHAIGDNVPPPVGQGMTRQERARYRRAKRRNGEA